MPKNNSFLTTADLPLQFILDASPVGMLIFNDREEIIAANPLAERLFAISSKTGSGQRCGDFIRCANRLKTAAGCGHASSCPSCPLLRGLRTALDGTATSNDLEGEAALDREPGCEPLWIRYKISPLVINGLRGALLSVNDISDLRRSEQQYAMLFREMINAFALHEIICDHQGQPVDYRFLDVNPAFEHMTGLRADQVVGRTVLDVFPDIESHWIDTYGQVALTGQPVHFENYSPELNKYFSINAFSPVPGQFACLFEDITTRKQAGAALEESEARMRAITDSAKDAILMMDSAGLVSFWNRAAEEIFGYTEEEAIGKDLHWLLAPQRYHDAYEKAYPGFQRTGQGKTVDKTIGTIIELQALHKNGHEIPVELSLAAIRAPHGWETIGVIRNITERKVMEEERKQLQIQLIQAQKMEAIGTLAGGIAHDFNNILGAVIGYAEMAREASPQNSAMAKDLDKVLEAGNRAAALVKQILAFSRQSGSERIALDPGQVVKEVVKLLRPSLPSTIAISQKTVATRSVLADPTQMHQVLMNLSTNAFHAMEQTGGTLEITLGEQELSAADLRQRPKIRPGDFVVLSVSDTGAGIAPAIRERIFEPYFTTKGVGQGTGLGLSIVHGIVTDYGGFITCESEPGQGATFRIFLPAIDGEAAIEDRSSDPLPIGSGHILLVDDEEMLTEMGRTMLERLGYEVTVRTSSLEALATFQNEPDRFDAVITDQTMPGMTGVDLARRMLQIRPNLPIILCTGYSNLVNEEQAKSYGIKGFAMKPLTKKEVALLLREVLDGVDISRAETAPSNDGDAP